jgi:hypothetical protein
MQKPTCRVVVTLGIMDNTLSKIGDSSTSFSAKTAKISTAGGALYVVLWAQLTLPNFHKFI